MFFLGLDMRHYKLNKGKGVQFRAIWDQRKEKRRKREKENARKRGRTVEKTLPWAETETETEAAINMYLHMPRSSK